MSLTRTALLTAVILAATALTLPIRAADRYYVGPNNGSWSDPANWSATPGGPGGAGVPQPGDYAFVTGSGPRAVSLDVSYATQLGRVTADGTGGACTIKQTSPSSALFSGDQIIGSEGIGRYEQSAGSNTISHFAGFTDQRLELGQYAGSSGTYVMSGGSLSITSHRFPAGLQIGHLGQGFFELSGGAVTVDANVDVGEGATGTFNQTGGSMTVGPGDSIFVGREVGAVGTYNFSNAQGPATLLVDNGVLYVGYSANGTFTQTGGNVTVQAPNANAGHVWIASGEGSNGHYTLNNGTLTAIQVAVGGASNPGGTGTLTVNGGTINAGLVVWKTDGIVDLNGGTINTCGTPPCGPDPADNILNNGTINIGGGTLNFGGRIYTTNTMLHPAAGGSLVSQTGGISRFAEGSNVQTGTVRIAGGAATSDGILLIGSTNQNGTGNGILDIRGGTTTINGTLGVGNGGTLSSGGGSGQVLVTGGTLNVQRVLLGSTSGGFGTLTVGPDAAIVCGSMGMNDVVMNGGTITIPVQAPPPGEDPVLSGSLVGGYLREGALHMHAGTLTAPKIKLGVTTGHTGTLNMDGGTIDVGILGVGNDATLTGGTGTGHFTISAGTLQADTVMLGSSAGGNGDMTVSGSAQLIVGGGFTANAFVVNGGTILVLDQAPPPGEDPVLDRSIVAGYLHDGSMTMTAGTVTTPNLKIGVTPGFVGSLTMTGGTLATSNLLAANGNGTVIALNGGTLRSGQSNVNKGSALSVGNGTLPAQLDLSPSGGTHTFADGLSIAANAQLTGAGTIVGNVTSVGRIAPGNSAGKITVDGNATLTAAGSVLVMELGGVAVGTYDQLAVLGSAALGGSLQLTLLPGFVPQNGQTFSIVTGSPVSGQFASVVAPLVSGLAFRVRYVANGVELDALTDSDFDTVADVVDNCPSNANRSQLDTDGDTVGDACDLNDGLNYFTAISRTGVDWQAETASNYNLYRSSRARLIATGEYTQDPLVEPEAERNCHVLGTHVSDAHNPPAGQVNLYLVNSIVGGVESSLGNRSNGAPRPNAHPCP